MPKQHPARTKMIDGVLHRWRRDKWVPIPEKWVGKVTHPQTVRKRRSKSHNHQVRRETKEGAWRRGRSYTPEWRERGPSASEWTE